ncbi:hypothetical protein NRB20_59180 [Nocardia sp. RB20]|uniref:Uncharacterized protein n=1 Tax=Nocardia macrotermitis TaxID=2585198 RepID=A0A7K0DAI9_9NOCA|nr:hypothetical protein [Nocardia macrotermitis]
MLLHFEKCDAALPGYRDVKRRLEKHLPDYDKSALRFSDFVAGLADAVGRAKTRSGTAGDEHRNNPSTGVWKLVELMSDESPQA